MKNPKIEVIAANEDIARLLVGLMSKGHEIVTSELSREKVVKKVL